MFENVFGMLPQGFGVNNTSDNEDKLHQGYAMFRCQRQSWQQQGQPRSNISAQMGINR